MTISDLLSKAVASPKSLKTKDGADALVLSLHCLMVDAGFITLDPKKRAMKTFAPPSDWRQNPLEWVIFYTRHGATSTFVLRCSLQEATGRLFIHASESASDNMPRRENIQVLGLQLTNYTSADRCQEKSWEGVIQNERTLTEMFKEFVLVPLWESAEKKLPEDAEDIENKSANSSLAPSPAATPRPAEPPANGADTAEKAVVASSSNKSSLFLTAAVGTAALTGVVGFYSYRHYKATGNYNVFAKK